MKILKFIFLTVLTVSLVACSNDDEAPSNDTSADLVGNWEASSFVYEGSTTTEAQGISLTSEFVGTGTELDIIIQFDENPNEFQTSGSYIIELETTTQGQTTTQNIPVQFDSSGTWSRSGTELSIITDGELSTATITELTETTLTYVASRSETQTQGDVTITTEVSETTTFIRQ